MCLPPLPAERPECELIDTFWERGSDLCGAEDDAGSGAKDDAATNDDASGGVKDDASDDRKVDDANAAGDGTIDEEVDRGNIGV